MSTKKGKKTRKASTSELKPLSSRANWNKLQVKGCIGGLKNIALHRLSSSDSYAQMYEQLHAIEAKLLTAIDESYALEKLQVLGQGAKPLSFSEKMALKRSGLPSPNPSLPAAGNITQGDMSIIHVGAKVDALRIKELEDKVAQLTKDNAKLDADFRSQRTQLRKSQTRSKQLAAGLERLQAKQEGQKNEA